MARILCGVPSYDGFIRSETAASLVNLQVPSGYSMSVKTFNGYGIADARNKMAQEAVDGGYGYLLMVDSDVVVPEDGLKKLLDISPGSVSTVSVGYYPRSSGDGEETCVYPHGSLEYETPYNIEEVMRFDSLYPIKGAGLGFALVNTDIFKRIRKPWFKQRFDSKGIGLSEDLWFCNACWEKGIPVMVHPGVRCGHIVSEIL